MAIKQNDLLLAGFKFVNGLYLKLDIVLAKEYRHFKKYNPPASANYVLTTGNWVHYIAELQTIDPSDLEEADNTEDVIFVSDLDGNGFWCKTDNPALELKQRLLDFEGILSRVFESHKESFWGMPSLDCIPTDNEFCCKAWVEFYLGEIKINPDFITAKSQVESLMYKYRKMVELYDGHKEILELL